ncbi:MAG: hypothetical protein J6X03_03285 [Bacilli bacterium]|nr:hypothetical protein [Bacilli bacterium]
MANPIAINGTHKRRETYANEVLAMAKSKINIYEDFSTDYEIDGATGGIKVPTRSATVTISDYDILNGVQLTQSATDYVDLPVDKNYAINELIDGYEAEAVPDNIRANRIEAAGYSLGLKKENMAITELVTNGTTSSDTDAMTKNNVYEKIAGEVSNMKKRNMEVAEMRIVIDADTELKLLTDEKFANTSGQLGAELIREGVIGKINGVPVKANYLLPEGVEAIIYDKRFIQKYEVWAVEPTIKDIQDDKHIGASHLVGSEVGGLAVTNALGVQLKTTGSVVSL